MGESGTGKSLVAHALHQWSNDRMLERLVPVSGMGLNDAALINVLATAPGGTVYLKDIDLLPLAAQQRLLQALAPPVTTRVVASTTKDLDAEVRAGRFRGDLRQRLATAQLWLTPLRDRPREISLLGRAFCEDEARKAGRRLTLTHGAIRQLHEHRWPGNVRELREVMSIVASVVRGEAIEATHVNAALGVR
jgi:DNA-binding NtrC family response regulator